MGFLEGKSVLISGCSGFIGQHLSRKVRELGGYVHAIRHTSLIPDDCADDVFMGDLRDGAFVRSVVFQSEPDYVFHLAAQAIVGKGQTHGRYTLDTNIMGTVNLLDALGDYNQDKQLHGVVVASTDKVYGRHKILPYTEEHCLLGTQQVYETSKVCEDVIAQMAFHSWGLPMGVTRFGNVYGPGDMNMTRLVPDTIHSFIKGVPPVIRSNGQHYRDFVFVDDVVDGYLKLAEYTNSHKDELNIFNFGTGTPVRVLDLVAMIGEYFPSKKTPQVLHGAKEEIHKQYVGSSKAWQELEWKANTKLRDGVVSTVEWYRRYFDVK